MDEQRKRAYRSLLYYGFVDIRNGLSWGWFPRPWHLVWKRNRKALRSAAILADALHNLAEFSMYDFVDFDEDLFWKYMEDVENVEFYKSQFATYLHRDYNEHFPGWKKKKPDSPL